MTGFGLLFGLLLLCASWVNLADVLSQNEITLKAIAEGFGIQISLTFLAIVIYAIGCIIPYFGNVLILVLAIVGGYYFPQMAPTFLCTAVGICLLLFSTSRPDNK